MPSEASTPITRTPAAAIGTAIRPVPTRQLDDRPARGERLLDVEVDVLGDRPAPRVVDAARSGRRRWRLARLPRDQHELPAVLVERPPVEPAVERLELQPGDVDQAAATRSASPTRARSCPPASSVMSSRLSDGTWWIVCGTSRPDRVALVRARRRVVEAERVPGEAARRVRSVRGDALERAAAVGPGRQVEQRADRARDQRGRLVELEVAQVAEPEVELDPCRRPRSRGPAPASPARGRSRSPDGRSRAATGTATRPVPTASSTTGPSASRASST